MTMNWWWCALFGAGGMALLYYGAEWMVRGGVAVARRCRISPLVIGLTLVAFATSAPELVVSIIAAWEELGDVSLGNIVGSNICNITVILGVSALIAPLAVNRRMLKLDMPLLLIISLVLTIGVLASGGVGRGLGVIFLLTGIGYTVFQIWSSRRENAAQTETEEAPPLKTAIAVLLVLLGIAALAGGARLFVDSAVFAARQLGISDAVIGLTVVAMGTSLPELATSAVAAFKGEQDIAIGNVVGSNLMNILIILGIAPLIRPIMAPGICRTDFAVMLAVTLVLAALMKFCRNIGRLAGAGFLLTACVYTVYLILR